MSKEKQVQEVVTALTQDDIDKLGLLLAKIAPDLKEIERLKAKIKSKGPGKYEGTFYEANVSVATRETLVAEKVREFLHPNQLRHATKETEVRSVEVTARKAA
jgi:hypothetical protein